MTLFPGPESAAPQRRNVYDVTNTVKVSSMPAVRDAVAALFTKSWPGTAFDALWLAFHDFDRLFCGSYNDYTGCDTVYHDIQHSLDMTLAMARLLAGYELGCDADGRLGDDRVVMGLVVALFHDAGYIRRDHEHEFANGAELTSCHVTRRAEFLRTYLPFLGMEKQAGTASPVVHFTGYEIDPGEIEFDDPKDRIVGQLLGTADLIAQMADRCYLEKCRDRLYPEFVLGGIAVEKQGSGSVRYRSGEDLLRQTLEFYQGSARTRLESTFQHAYRHVEPLFDGRNPYMESIRQNLDYLGHIIATENWGGLRRQPPCFTVTENPLESVGMLVDQYLADTPNASA